MEGTKSSGHAFCHLEEAVGGLYGGVGESGL